MATDTVDPLSMPCRNVPKKGFFDELYLSGRGVTILGLLLILLIALIPRGLTPYPDPPIIGGGEDSLGLSTIVSEASKDSKVIVEENIAGFICTSDGGFVLAINTYLSVTDDRDILLIKINGDGHVLWNQNYRYDSFIEISALFQTSDGGYALFGRLWSEQQDAYLTWFLKTDAGGNMEWNKTLEFQIPINVHYFSIQCIAQTSDGGFVLAGIDRSLTAVEFRVDMWLMKISDKISFEWRQTYSGVKEWQDIHEIIQTKDSGFLLIGSTSSGSGNSPDVQLIKTDNRGIKEWIRTYGGFDSDHGISAVQTKDEGFVFVSSTNSFNIGGTWLVKIDNSGNTEWSQVYGDKDGDEPCSLIQTKDDGFAIGGCIYGHSTDSNEMWLVKTDSNGIKEWDQSYEGSNDEKVVSFVQTQDGGFLMAGFSSIEAVQGAWLSTDSDVLLVKTDKIGNEVWNRAISGNFAEEWVNDLVQTIDGGFVFIGGRGSENLEGLSGWLVKTDGNGIMTWNQTFTGFSATTIIQTADEGFVIAGSTCSQGVGKSDVWLIKTDRNGRAEWNKTYGGTEKDGAETVIQTSEGGFAIAGYTNSFSAGDSDAWLIKTDSNGIEEWNQTFGGEKDDKALKIFQLDNGSFVLFGYFGNYFEHYSCGNGGCFHHDRFDQAWLLVTDENGMLNRNFSYERPGYVRFQDLLQSNDGTIIHGLSAIQDDPTSGGDMSFDDLGQNSIFSLKMNSSGIFQWNRTLGDLKWVFHPLIFGTSQCGDLIHTEDGGFLIFGYKENINDNYYDDDGDPLLVKMDSNGEIQWNLTYTEEILNTNTVLIQTADGGFALAGGVLSHETGGTSADAWLSRIDENGTMLWEQAYGTTEGHASNLGEWHPRLTSPVKTSFISWAFVITTLFVLISVRKKRPNVNKK